jgi:hypothetical protein
MGIARIRVRATVAIQLFGVAHAQDRQRCTAGSCRLADRQWTGRGGAYASNQSRHALLASLRGQSAAVHKSDWLTAMPQAVCMPSQAELDCEWILPSEIVHTDLAEA